MVTESKGTTVVAGLIHKGPTVSYRYTTLLDATIVSKLIFQVNGDPALMPFLCFNVSGRIGIWQLMSSPLSSIVNKLVAIPALSSAATTCSSASFPRTVFEVLNMNVILVKEDHFKVKRK